jgi:hypothetical protein
METHVSEASHDGSSKQRRHSLAASPHVEAPARRTIAYDAEKLRGDTDRRRARRLVSEAVRLTKPLGAAFPCLDTELVEDAISQSLIELMDAVPAPADANLRSFLYRAAWRNLHDISKSERARKERERAWARDGESTTTVSEEDFDRLRQAIAQIQELLPDDRLRKVFALRAGGERRTSVYADALGIELGEAANAAVVVKREKDRLDKHLRRDVRIRRIAGAALQRES